MTHSPFPDCHQGLVSVFLLQAPWCFITTALPDLRLLIAASWGSIYRVMHDSSAESMKTGHFLGKHANTYVTESPLALGKRISSPREFSQQSKTRVKYVPETCITLFTISVTSSHKISAKSL